MQEVKPFVTILRPRLRETSASNSVGCSGISDMSSVTLISPKFERAQCCGCEAAGWYWTECRNTSKGGNSACRFFRLPHFLVKTAQERPPVEDAALCRRFCGLHRNVRRGSEQLQSARGLAVLMCPPRLPLAAHTKRQSRRCKHRMLCGVGVARAVYWTLLQLASRSDNRPCAT